MLRSILMFLSLLPLSTVAGQANSGDNKYIQVAGINEFLQGINQKLETFNKGLQEKNNKDSNNQTSNDQANSQATANPTVDKDVIVLIQQKLNNYGYNAGPADGVAGKRTRDAIEDFERANKLEVTGNPSLSLLGHLTKSESVERGPGKNNQNTASVGEETSRPSNTNNSVVKFSKSCPGLSIPKVFLENYKGLVEQFSMIVSNKSNYRYTLNYDMTYTRQGRGGYIGTAKEQHIESKSMVATPDTDLVVRLIHANSSTHRVISIDKIAVYRCTKD